MIETLREIILDFQEVGLETGVPRHLKSQLFLARLPLHRGTPLWKYSVHKFL